MKRIIVRKISFGSYVKLFSLSGVGFGVIIGVLTFVISLLGGPAYFTFGNTTFAGLAGGSLALIMSPILGGFVFLWFSIFMFLPFKLTLKILKGITIKALIKDANDQNADEQMKLSND